MKGSKIAKTVIIAVILAAIILVYYYSLGHRAKRQQVEDAIAATVVPLSIHISDPTRPY